MRRATDNVQLTMGTFTDWNLVRAFRHRKTESDARRKIALEGESAYVTKWPGLSCSVAGGPSRREGTAAQPCPPRAPEETGPSLDQAHGMDEHARHGRTRRCGYVRLVAMLLPPREAR